MVIVLIRSFNGEISVDMFLITSKNAVGSSTDINEFTRRTDVRYPNLYHQSSSSAPFARALSGVILSAEETGYKLLKTLPKIAITKVEMMIAGVGEKCKSPPPRIIFAILLVIVIPQELKIAIAINASIIPMIEEINVRETVSAKKSLRTKPFSAPIARIVPISPVRSITETVIVFMMIMNRLQSRPTRSLFLMP